MFFLLLLLLASAEGRLPQSHAVTEKVENEPKVILVQAGNYSVSLVPLISIIFSAIPRFFDRFRPQQGRSITPQIPSEFEGRNPCIDSILVRKKYPKSDCHFYQCELFQPSTPACRLQVIDDTTDEIDRSTVTSNNIVLRISECVSIRIYTCAFGFAYSEEKKGCVRFLNHLKQPVCLT